MTVVAQSGAVVVVAVAGMLATLALARPLRLDGGVAFKIMLSILALALLLGAAMLAATVGGLL
ncbi:MAG: hypothetical protein JOZ41_18055 [Chloroflexi bacterium]|nr:hypothetical protein [Chloroflexota bacterium]